MGRRRKTEDQQPSELEMQILGVLWEDREATVRQVLERLSDGRDRAYTSVLSVMQVMHKKGLIETKAERDGLAHVYVPRVRREDIVKPLLRGLVQRVFGGSTQMAIQHLIDDDEIDRDEIAELRKMLDDVESRKGDS